MQSLYRIIYLVVVFGLLTWLAPAAEETTEAPYFVIPGQYDQSSADLLPLKSASAKVAIDGTIAHVRLNQHYVNAGRDRIEATYVFPASTRSAVHCMTLKSGGKVISARIKKAATAKQEYAKAKAC